MTEAHKLPGEGWADEGFGTPADLSDWEPDLATKDRDAAEIYQQKTAERDFSPSPLPAWEE